MAVISIFLMCSAFIALGLGIAVFANNYQRKVNQAFLASSACLFLWLLDNFFILHTKSPDLAKTRINLAFAISSYIPTTFQLIRISIALTTRSWNAILSKSAPYFVVNIIICIMCFLPNFTHSVSFPPDELSIATPDYGLPYHIFNIYFIASIVLLAANLHRDKKMLTGAQQVELEFLGFACFAGLVVGLLCGTIFAFLIKSSALVPIAHSISVLVLITIVSYGISVHKILAVAVILRKTVAYSLLACYLSTLYLAVWFISSFILKEITITHSFPPHILATVVVLASMTPARRKMERAASKLIALETSDIPSILRRANSCFQSVTTQSSLFSQFSNLIISSFRSSSVVILRRDGGHLIPTYASQTLKSFSGSIPLNSALPSLIAESNMPACRDSLTRAKPTPKTRQAIEQIDSFGVGIAIGFFSKLSLNGVVMLGQRENGRIYDKTEQDALQILCNQFAVALENAQMYTEMQDSKIRNEIMLDQLVSGVILADTKRTITLFNHEAQRITDIKEEAAIGHTIDILPESIRETLDSALQLGCGERNLDAQLFEQDEERGNLNIRMGTTFLHGHDCKPMGALMVFTDMTELRGLEAQVRRADQLSSVGTLAAGMAHEIKNPLVTIKTFTQLLPERYSEKDFREDFSSLVADEVSRIDGIVNQLLSFSKPAKPHLVPMNLHDTIEQTIKLTHEQMAQRNIAAQNNCSAQIDRINGDAKLLSQALVNLMLNAIQAINENGTITVGTTNCHYRFAVDGKSQKSTTRNCIRLQITDTGKGIPQENLQKIFDPFFTSKSEGTGMGLSVAHGIISEHHGVVEVESISGKGTTFYLYIPVIDEAAL